MQKIESYGRAYDTLETALSGFPEEMWRFKPPAGGWSIHEIIVHITDSEANSYIRCRRLVAEPGEPLMAYDENRWARELDYHSLSTRDALELFGALRRASYHMVRSLPEPVWAHQALHPENGMTSLDDWLDTYERHVPDHIAQMARVHDDWHRLQD
jgi:uncharacterized damage-inducible protein DinB